MARGSNKPGSRRNPGRPAVRAADSATGPAGGAAGSPAAAIDPRLRRRARIELAGGGALVIAAGAIAMASDGGAITAAGYAATFGPALLGLVAIAVGAARLTRRAVAPPHADVRRWIYAALALGFAGIYALCIWKVIPNRLPSAQLHLWSVPVLTVAMGAGAALGGRHGWWLALVAASAILLSTILMIARILASAAFLAGVYGAFGKAAATFAVVAVALIVEVVALLPICQVRFLMSRAGRRAYGV